MITKPEFNTEILKHFKEFTTQFHFEIQDVSTIEIQFHNDKCILRFMYDMGRVVCHFISPQEKKIKESVVRKDGFPSGFPIYSAYSVWKLLYQNDKNDYNYTGWDIEGQVIAEKKLLLERLTNVLKGDFSWINAYKANDSRLSEKIEYMMTHWAVDNPVRVKFWNGDASWEKEFDEYKKYLDELQ